MATRGNVVTLTGANLPGKIARKTIHIPKGKQAPAWLLKCTAPVNNATGGALASGLSLARKKALLALFHLTLTHGRNGHRKPFNTLPCDKLRQLSRYATGLELRGWNDTSTGMERALPDATTTNVTWYSVIPTGAMYQLTGGGRTSLMGVGRSQAQTMELELKYVSATIDTGITIIGNVNIELIPLLQPRKGDVFCYFPEYMERSEADREAKLEAGLPLLLVERTAVHASSTLENFDLMVDGEVIHSAASAADVLAELNYTSNFRDSDADLTGDATVLYEVPANAEFHDLPTGAPIFRQNVKNLTTASLGYYYVPIVPDDAVKADVADAASARGKQVRAVSIATLEGLLVEDRQRFAVPFRLTDSDDFEFNNAGLLGKPSEAMAVESMPMELREQAVARINQAMEGRNEKLAQKVYSAVAASIPGAVQNARGFNSGSSRTYAETQRLIQTGGK
jgi:hypothetical protein